MKAVASASVIAVIIGWLYTHLIKKARSESDTLVVSSTANCFATNTESRQEVPKYSIPVQLKNTLANECLISSDQPRDVLAEQCVANNDQTRDRAISACDQPRDTMTDDYLISSEQAEAVLGLLNSSHHELVENALFTITKTAAFTQNQTIWRNVGGLSKISALLTSQVNNYLEDSSSANSHMVTTLLNTVINLSANEQNQLEMQDVLQSVMDLSTTNSVPENVQLTALQVLTNFSLINFSHQLYTKIIQQLYEMVDTGTHELQLQVLKILVNLSCNDVMIPYLLAAQASTKLPKFIEPQTREDILLRAVTFLSHVVSAVDRLKITASSLPHCYKAASPDTMFTALFGINNIGKLKSRFFVLTHHINDEVKQRSASAYSQLISL